HTRSKRDWSSDVCSSDLVAEKRGQSLAQMALAWVLRDERITSALIGASSVEQLDQNLDSTQNLEFSDAELAEIDKHAVDADINKIGRASCRERGGGQQSG